MSSLDIDVRDHVAWGADSPLLDSGLLGPIELVRVMARDTE